MGRSGEVPRVHTRLDLVLSEPDALFLSPTYKDVCQGFGLVAGGGNLGKCGVKECEGQSRALRPPWCHGREREDFFERDELCKWPQEYG